MRSKSLTGVLCWADSVVTGFKHWLVKWFEVRFRLEFDKPKNDSDVRLLASENTKNFVLHCQCRADFSAVPRSWQSRFCFLFAHTGSLIVVFCAISFLCLSFSFFSFFFFLMLEEGRGRLILPWNVLKLNSETSWRKCWYPAQREHRSLINAQGRANLIVLGEEFLKQSTWHSSVGSVEFKMLCLSTMLLSLCGCGCVLRRWETLRRNERSNTKVASSHTHPLICSWKQWHNETKKEALFPSVLCS